MTDLLRTKLFVPRPRANLVSRQRLFDRLNGGSDKKLTLITAPAGFGKTTLVSEWITCRPPAGKPPAEVSRSAAWRDAAWLSLDEGDNDPVRFLTYIVVALQTIDADFGGGLLGALQSPTPPPVDAVLTSLLNEIAAHEEASILVLDDYHVVDAEAVDSALAYLIEHSPPQMRLVIATREDPQLPLARLRARGQLTELRAADLRFTPAESAEFLQGVMKVNVSAEDVAALETRTEGWIAGLQLAALAMQGMSSLPGERDAAHFIRSFTGSHHFVLDYLIEEVLQRQPESVQAFLLQTSILDRMCGSLCDAVLLSPTPIGESTLASLDRLNLFIVPLDDERRWYRYHHLFSDLLRGQLTRSHPELAPELHQRASIWYEQNGDIAAAVEHALQNPDLTRAARLIAVHAISMLYQGQVALVMGWFDRLPEATLLTDPMLCVSKAWAAALMRRETCREDVYDALELAGRALEYVDADEALATLIAGHTASVRVFNQQVQALKNKQAEMLIVLSQKAQRLLPDSEKGIRSVNGLNIGYGSMALADLEAARSAFRQVLEDGLAGGNLYAAVYGPAGGAYCAFLEGKLAEALQLCETNIERFNKILAGQTFLPLSALNIIKGRVFLEYNRLAEAEAELSEGLEQARWLREYEPYKMGCTSLARLRAIQGNMPAMLEAVMALEAAWPLSASYAQSTRYRLSMRCWADDPEVQEGASTWLKASGIDFEALETVDCFDPINIIPFEINLNAAHILARLVKLNAMAYPVEAAHVYLQRQQDFVASRGFLKPVVEAALARAALYQACGLKQGAQAALTEALEAGMCTDLLRTFVDECDLLKAPLEALRLRASNERLIAYMDHLLEAVNREPAKAASAHGSGTSHGISPHGDTPSGAAPLSERELEVLRFLVSGLSYEEIGQRLYLSLNTIQFHVKNIYRKLLVNKRMQAIERAKEMNLV